MSGQDSVIIGGVALFVCLITLVPIVGGLWYARHKLHLAHAERMKALEWGIVLPECGGSATRDSAATSQSNCAVENQASLARKSFSTGLWVAFWGFAAASGLAGTNAAAGVAYAIAAATGAIGVTAMICGTILALCAAGPQREGDEAKPITAEDAYDVVSCRG